MAIRIKIKSDKGITRCLDSLSGERIAGITKVEIEHLVGSIPEIILHIESAEPGQYEVEGDAKFYVRSTVADEMKQVKQIEFMDGEVINYEVTP